MGLDKNLQVRKVYKLIIICKLVEVCDLIKVCKLIEICKFIKTYSLIKTYDFLIAHDLRKIIFLFIFIKLLWNFNSQQFMV